jgi:ATP-dependent Lhr-like helicase
VARGLDYRFAMQYVYEYDQPRGERQLAALSLNRSLLAELLQDGSLAELLKPEAVAEVSARVSRTGPEARLRSAEELAQLLFDVGDLSDAEIEERGTHHPAPDSFMRGGPPPEAASGPPRSPAGEPGEPPVRQWLQQLEAAGRVLALEIAGERRWISAERRGDYQHLAANPSPVLRRHLMHSGPTSVQRLAARYGLAEPEVRDVLPALADDVVAGEFTPGGGEQLLDRRTLEQMHRRTLTILRKEVQPVPLAAYADFLRRWQHVRADRALELNQVLQQLRGFAVHGVSWERDVLPARLQEFDPALLAERCQSGELMWVAEGGRDPRRARVRFFFRGEGGLFLDRAPAADTLAALGEPAHTVYDFLKEEGAALLADIADGTALDGRALQEALVELVLAGLVTNDSLAALHAVLGCEPPAGSVSPGSGGRGAGMRSSLEAQLAALRPDQPRRMTRFGWRDARRRAREAAFAKTQTRAPRTGFVGRWSLVHRASLLGKALTEDERALRQTRQLLARWGIVTRTSLERESPLLRWEAIYPVLARLEMRGEVRRGYFVQGLPGLQFALPEVVEQVRAVNAEANAERSDDMPIVVLSAVDPAQLFGGGLWQGSQASTVDGTGNPSGAGGALRFARVPTSAVASSRGEPVAAMEDGGASVTAVDDHPQLVPALRALASWWMARAAGTEAGPIPLAAYRATGTSAYHRVKVEHWQGQPVLDSPGVPILEAAGFVREGSAMLWTGHARERLPA